jgi:PAS domain S-box-containing protein
MANPQPEDTSESSLALFSDELARLAQSLGTARDLMSVFRALRRFAEALTGSNSLFVSLLEPGGNSRRCVYAWTDGEEVDVSSLPLLPMSGGPHARAVASGQVVVVEDLQSALENTPNIALGYDRDPRRPTVSIALPLAVFGRVIGGFEVQLFEHLDPWASVPALQIAANLAAAATENVRLVETERELRFLAEASEQNYRTSEQRLRLALEATGLAAWDADVPSRTITWSGGIQRLFGRQVDDQPRDWQALLELIHADDRPLVERILAAEATEIEIPETEFRLTSPSGDVRWVAVRGHRSLEPNGRVRHVSGVVLDITARKEAERQREWLARSEQLRVLGQMASGIAHDLNQKLALISGYGELARQELSTPQPELARTADLLDVVIQAAQDGAATLRRLLSFARTESAEAFEVLDMGELLREVAKLTAPRWRGAIGSGASIRLRLEIDTTADLHIEGSPAALREGFTNLVFNAVDALAGGGTITLRAMRQGARVLAQVSDTGPGIPPDLQARVFEPFFTTKGEQGTGLGLAQVAGLVARHSGEIVLESAPGKGATFSLSFPAASRAAQTVEQAASTAPAPTARRRVLAVDDELPLRRLVSIMLSSEGHDVTIAASAEEALELLERQTFDVVLSDVNMGEGMTGWELADRIRERWPDLPIVLVSGLGAQITEDEMRAHGVAAVLAKPYRAAEIRGLIARFSAQAER